MEVALLDLTRQWRTVGEEVERAVREVLAEGRFVLGRRVEEFEAALADYCGVSGGVGVASGSDALFLALRALGVSAGDEVVTTPFTFIATAEAIWRCGARPVFVDVDPATFNLDAERIEEAVTDRTRAILPVHLFGQPADMDPILTLAEVHGLAVLEDAVQAVGGEYKGKRAGGLGDLASFSFFPAKNLGGAGDGGMVVGEDGALLDRVRSLRRHGIAGPGRFDAVGLNSRLDAIQAAVLGVKLRHLDAWNEARRAHAAVYDEAFLPMEEVAPPPTLEGATHVYHQYVIRARDRDALARHLADRAVETAVYYPVPLHLQACFASLGHRPGDFPEAERAAEECLALPVYPELTEGEQAHVIESTKEFYAA